MQSHEDDYLRIQDGTMNHLDFNRFLYMPPGTKNKPFDWRLDWEKKKIPCTEFIIDSTRYVNRPDNVAFDNYGNAKYWWVIAMANDIRNPFIDFNLGRKIKIPDLDLVKREFWI
ncbi:MAG: baseplate wedge protein 53 [Silvanigrellaceae bacterium]|nr:baseplate wedge protein 53 [Silvanigrellaceae bacterium]